MSRYTLSFVDDRGDALWSELLDCATEAEAINTLQDRAGLYRVQLRLEDQTILEIPGDSRPRRPHASHGRRSSRSTYGAGAAAQT